MEITEVKFWLPDKSDHRVLAYCSVTFDNSFVVRDLRVIDRETHLFVAMPSRKVTRECERCGGKNNLRVNFCNHCGTSLAYASEEVWTDSQGRETTYVDVAHPITQRFRRKMEREIISRYENFKSKAG